MAIVPLTLTISLCLVFTFIVFFLAEHARGRLNSAERNSLMPLADETPRLALARTTRAHDHAGDDCGCRDGSRRPCPGCAKRHEHV